MSEFVQRFVATFSAEDKRKLLEDERDRRVPIDPERYILLPAGQPVPGRLAGTEDIVLLWFVASPGLTTDQAGNPVRAPVFAMPDEETALDVAYILNNARAARTIENFGGTWQGKIGIVPSDDLPEDVHANMP